MPDITYLEEYRLKKELEKAQNAMNTARNLVASGVKVPSDVLGRLQYLINQLEQKLADYIESGDDDKETPN